MAALPAANWSATSACDHVTVDCEREPWSSRSLTSCSASAVSGVSMSFSSPPLDHMNGKNCQVPS